MGAKYKYEFLIAIVGLISTVAGFLGYSSIESIESAVRADFKVKVDSVKRALNDAYVQTDVKLLSTNKELDQIAKNVVLYQGQLQSNKGALKKLVSDQNILKSTNNKSQKDLFQLSLQIDSINAANKIKREFYLIKDAPINGKYAPDVTPVKFFELRTSSGDRLPKFKKPPIVIPAINGNTTFRIDFTNIDGFGVTILDNGETLEATQKKIYLGSFIVYPVD